MYGIIEDLCGYFIGAQYGIQIQYECFRENEELYLDNHMILGMGLEL